MEKFIHETDTGLPILIKAGLIHAQFETIHPFLDGNGRLGRLLISLILSEAEILTEPILYLSLYLKTHRQAYYRLLTEVREKGNWQAWLAFFLDGVTETARNASETAIQLNALFQSDAKKIATLGRARFNAQKLFVWLQKHPIASPGAMAKGIRLTPATTGKAISHLVKLGILSEITGRKRQRLFTYAAYLSRLSEGTEPL